MFHIFVKLLGKNITLIMKKKQIITLFLLLYGTVISAQTKKEIIKSMIEEVTYLASDELEGRATGTDSEKLAADFIGQKFLEYNLQEKGIGDKAISILGSKFWFD